MVDIERQTAGILNDASVAMALGARSYAAAPFSPSEAYPEYPLDQTTLCGQRNEAYAAVREVLFRLDLDRERFGSAEWNPLGRFIGPGRTVVLKPNFVRDFRQTQTGHGDCLITHGSVIRAVVDYAYKALAGRGRIIIADAPHNDADFDAVRRIAGLDEIQDFYRRAAGFEIEVIDLRPEKARLVNSLIVGHDRLPGDPAGYAAVNLGKRSMFAEVEHLCGLIYGADYDIDEVRRHHRDGAHEYLISRTVLQADCVIVLSKLKTHKKVGLTVNLKNLVGINGNKNWLPHHREGSPSNGGDQFPDDRAIHRLERAVLTPFKRAFRRLGPLRPVLAWPAMELGKLVFGDTNAGTIRSGNWHGNDTTWRMAVDLNRILLYADPDGGLHDRPVRQVFCVVDGIVAGEGEGPLDPTPRPAGAVIAGANPLAVDLACARFMGMDWRRLPILHGALRDHPLPLLAATREQVRVHVAGSSEPLGLDDLAGSDPPFRMPCGWRRQLEIADLPSRDSTDER